MSGPTEYSGYSHPLLSVQSLPITTLGNQAPGYTRSYAFNFDRGVSGQNRTPFVSFHVNSPYYNDSSGCVATMDDFVVDSLGVYVNIRCTVPSPLLSAGPLSSFSGSSLTCQVIWL